LKNSFAVAPVSVVEKVGLLERSQSDANDPVDGLRAPKLLVEKREASFSTEYKPQPVTHRAAEADAHQTLTQSIAIDSVAGSAID
jgi:hypothetical protein